MIYNLKQAKELGNQFAEELQEKCGVPLKWWFVGSIRDGKYKAGKSDIDMVIIPEKKGYIHPKILLDKMEDYKKYGTVFKKGRDISLIDVVIFFDLKAVNMLRKLNKELKIMKDATIIGKPKMETKTKFASKPKKKYRVIIQERKATGNKIEKCRSFMIYDFQGRTNVDSIKKRLQKK